MIVLYGENMIVLYGERIIVVFFILLSGEIRKHVSFWKITNKYKTISLFFCVSRLTNLYKGNKD